MRILALSIYFLFIYATESITSYTVDISSSNTSPIWSFWQSSTTFDHGYQALRQDWREQLLQTHLDLGTQFIRFHETFDDDIGIVNPRNPTTGNGNSPYSYINIDKIYDYILSIGMKPLVEMDMMPSSFVPSTQTSTMFNRPVYVGPPSNYTQWKDFITQFFKHLTDRYGAEEISKWAFEAWNEPNCGDNWLNYNLTSFLETWNITAHAIKAVNKNYNIGGPASCGRGWIPEFPQWCKDNNVPIDFVSTHVYPTNKKWVPQTHNGFMLSLQNLSAIVDSVDPDLKIYITAYGCTVEGNSFNMGSHDTSYNAACFMTFGSQFQALNTKQYGLMSFTGFSDLWDQKGVFSSEFHNGYGWQTVRGIKKPTYRMLQLLYKYASNRQYIKGVNGNNDKNNTLELFATINEDKSQIVLFIANWMMEKQPISDQTVMINITNIDDNVIIPSFGTLYRIDTDNTNPAEIWNHTMGAPMYPTQQQLDILTQASQLKPQIIDIYSATSNSVSFKLDIPVYGIAVIIVDI